MLEIDDKDNFYLKGLGNGFFRIANLIDLMGWFSYLIKLGQKYRICKKSEYIFIDIKHTTWAIFNKHFHTGN